MSNKNILRVISKRINNEKIWVRVWECFYEGGIIEKDEKNNNRIKRICIYD